MKTLIRFEYRKLWNKVSIIALVALIIITVLYSLVLSQIQRSCIDKDGNLVSGLSAYRALKEATEDIEGEMDDAYLKDLIKKYNASKEKMYMEETNPGYLAQGGHTKFEHSNYTINYAYFGYYISAGNTGAMSLDYDFLKSADCFYKQYKKAAIEEQMLNGSQKMTDARKKAIQRKIDQVKTPFTHKYCEGWVNTGSYFGGLYWIFMTMLAFALIQTYAKNCAGGITQLTISTIHGRRKDMIARWISGNLFTVVSYLIWLTLIIIPQTAIATLHGWDASAQILDYALSCNMNIGAYTLVGFLDGLVGALAMANLVMFVSIKLKNIKLGCVVMGIVIFLLKIWQSSYIEVIRKLRYFNPLNFVNCEDTPQILFIGNFSIDYFIVAILLGGIYIGIIYFFLQTSYKRYKIA